MKQSNLPYVRYVLASKYNSTIELIPNVDEIIENGKLRAIRYVPGEPSIYMDEQSHRADKIKTEIVFLERMKTVMKTEKTLIDFLAKCNYNEDNPSRREDREVLFRVWDPDKTKKIQYEKEMEQYDVVNIIRNMGMDEMASIAMTLGMDVNREEKAIKYDLLSFAKSNPAGFLANMKDPKTKKKYLVLQAIKGNVLRHDTSMNSIFYVNGGQCVIQSPAGSDAIEDLCNFLMTEDGRKFELAILELLHPERKYQKPGVQKKSEDEGKDPNADPVNPDAGQGDIAPELSSYPSGSEDWKESSAWKMIEIGIDNDIIVHKGNWFEYRGQGALGGKGILKKFEEDPQLWKDFKFDLEQATE